MFALRCGLVCAMAAHGLTKEEFEKSWSMNIGAERSLGRPKEWDGRDPTFDEFSFRFTAWLSGLPGGADVLLDHAAMHAGEISVGTMTAEQQAIAK